MAEPRATLGTDELERFLADRAPVAAPPALADAIVRGAASLPQVRRGLTLPGFGGPAWARHAFLPVAALLVVGLLLALLALASIGRPRPVVPDEAWVQTSIGDPGSTAMVIGGGAGSLFAATWPNGVPFEDRVWSSSDGVTWAPLADQSPFVGASIAGFSDLGKSVLAYGSRVDEAGRETIATWTSDDGISWRLLSGAGSVNPMTGQQREHLSSVAVGGPGFVGIGTVTAEAFDGAVAWTSTDGVAWTRATTLDGYAVIGLARVNNGFVALTHSDQVASSISPEGVTWKRGTFPDTGPCCVSADIANLPGGTPLGAIAVGGTGAGAAIRPFAWTTRDGASWTQLELPAPPESCVVTASWPSCPVTATAVAADAEHVVVAGSTSTTQTGPLRAVLWSSRDGGRTWAVSAADPSLVLDPQQSDRQQNAVLDLWAGGPNAFYAVGRTQQSGATVWSGHPFPPSAP